MLRKTTAYPPARADATTRYQRPGTATGDRRANQGTRNETPEPPPADAAKLVVEPRSGAHAALGRLDRYPVAGKNDGERRYGRTAPHRLRFTGSSLRPGAGMIPRRRVAKKVRCSA